MKKIVFLSFFSIFIFFIAGCVGLPVIDCNRYSNPDERAACLKGLEELKAEIAEAKKQAAYEYGRGYVYPYYPAYSYPGYYGGRSCYNYSESRYKKGKSSYYNYSYCY